MLLSNIFVLRILLSLQYQFLKPAVVILTGTNDIQRETHEDFIRRYMKNIFGEKLQVNSITAKDDKDKEAIFGNPADPVMRGLFRWIDDVNNPVHMKNDTYGLVTFNVNDLGQFMIRELLENTESKTHKNSIRKDRIMFLVNIVVGEISPQLYSRAHDIVMCNG